MTTTIVPGVTEKETALHTSPVLHSEFRVPTAVYIHIPFCHHRCSYCDFNIYAGMRALYEPYATAVAEEIAATASRAGRVRVPSIYIGGGTPSLFPAELIGGLLTTVRAFFDVDENAEITLEVNPTADQGKPTTDSSRWPAAGYQYFGQLGALDVNRLSLGVQSSHEHELHLLRRGHSFRDAINTYRAMRDVGFANVNLDLIYGLPDQSLDEWRVTLQRVIDLQPDHISAYSLQIEERTAMIKWLRAGHVSKPDDDVVAEMYELAEEMLDAAGFAHYEISNWARRRRDGETDRWRQGFRSRHNLVYWRNEPYFGFGCGAHSFQAGHRFANVKHPREYIQQIVQRGDAVVEVEGIDRALEMGETMMLGLRMVEEGVKRARFKDRFGVELNAVYGATIANLIRKGLLESDDARVRLTPKGRLLGNRVFGEFLPDAQ